VRIPLDYYQILGVPESNLSGLEQAYQDRLLQLPRQEYSDAAIDSRKQLITTAYQVLSDPARRAEYVATQLAPVAADAADARLYCRRELDIATEHFLGGLLILFEQGEYEEINSICMPYLGNNGRNSNSGSLHPHPQMSVSTSGNLRGDLVSNIDPAILARLKQTVNGAHIIPLKPDIVLAMVSSFYELGEREWGEGCYEEAVIHYETAKKILVQEDIFPQIQGQIDLKLDRLQPYRISFLVSLALDRLEQRGQGIQFLEELIESACTNELECQAKFGLNNERTIEFIYKNLPYLTAAEQRNLFSRVARDANGVGSEPLNGMQVACTYLHVHALIVQGFAYRNPQLIYTAQQILEYRLSKRWNVPIEQSICALLLGQTAEASQILATANESSALLVINQQSNGLSSPIRGLCFYVESWLKDEAFPCFRDLVNSGDPSLEAYFNNRDVQDFADRVPTADSDLAGWATSSPQLIEVPPSGDLSGTVYLKSPDSTSFATTDSNIIFGTIATPCNNLLPTPIPTGSFNTLSVGLQPHSDRLGDGPIAPAVRVDRESPANLEQSEPSLLPVSTAEVSSTNVIQLERERNRRRSNPTARTIDGQFEQLDRADRSQTLLVAETSGELATVAKSGILVKSNRGSGNIVRPRRIRRRANIPRILLVGTGVAASVWGATFLAAAISREVPGSWGKIMAMLNPPTAAPVVKNTNIVNSVPKQQPKTASSGLLTTDVAQATIKTWLSSKTKSLDLGYQTAQLPNILVDPALAKAIDRSKSVQGSGIHLKYQHQNIAVSSITQASPLANVATIQARVDERAQYYKDGQLDPSNSYSKQLVVEYDLVRQQDRWYVKDMHVVN
jgi:hypothetical protein